MSLLPKTLESLRKQAREEATSYPNAMRSQNITRTRQIALVAEKTATEVREMIEGLAVVVDDEIPPGVPAGVDVSTASRALVVTWDLPPHDDWVESSRVEISRVDSPEVAVHDTQDVSYVALGLEPVPYEVRVKHVDRWGLESQWSSPVTATPDRSVADDIAENLQINANRIFGELGLENIPVITSAEKLVAGVKNALVQAGQTEDRYISANLLAAWDVVAGRAIIADATVDNALIANLAVSEGKIDNLAVTSAKIADLAVTTGKVNSLVADKISAGVLKAAVSITSGGSISTGGALLDQTGVTLAETNTSAGFPSQSPGSWLTPRPTPALLPSPFAGVGFFQTTSGEALRGVSIVADGVATTARQGMVRLIATNGSQNTAAYSTALIRLQSSAGSGNGGLVVLKEHASIEGDVSANGNMVIGGTGSVAGGLSAGSFSTGGQATFQSTVAFTAAARLTAQYEITATIAASSSQSFNLPLGPKIILAQYAASGNWFPFVDNIAGLRIYATTSGLLITNNNTTLRNVRVQVWL